ncbi:MAG: zinc-ribbon domain-containing protein [Myxococcales bacterium]|nr:zinc-ribbon domain-containing protein [Myxococcales bacterium]
MDVTCPRCQTDYEFDDALVSERGTTVKCTNCGHQFRVHRQRSGGAAVTSGPEVWKIEQASGTLELRSLVELQRAIRAGKVVRTDLLRKGDGPARHVGDIPELEPFFPVPRPEQSAHTLPLPAVEVSKPPVAHTPAYGKPGVEVSAVAFAPTAKSTPPPRPPPPRTSERPRVPTPLGMSPVARTPVPIAPARPQPPLAVPVAAPLPEVAPAPLPTSAPEQDPPTVRRMDRVASTQPEAPPPSRSFPPDDGPAEEFFTEPPPPRRSSMGWIVGGVVVAGAILLGGTVGRPYLARLTSPSPITTVSGSSGAPRLDKELANELAIGQWIGGLASASTFALEQGSTLGASAGKSCARWGDLARGEADGAKKVGSDLRFVRALAAQGDVAGVRLYLPSHPGEPIMEALIALADVTKKDTAAVNAAAKSAATALGKATPSAFLAPADVAIAAWVAQASGDATRGTALLGELEKRAPKHVLLGVLRGTTKLEPVKTDAGVDARPDAPADAPLVAVGVGTGEVVATGDFRSLNEAGYKALAAGEPGKAEGYFKSSLAQHPGDVDALYGLGQIARARGEHASAISYFKQVLDSSAGFAPARLALADEQWSQGQQADAKKNYELYLERMPDGPGAERAKSRTGKSDVKPETPAPAPTPTPTPTPKPEDP